MARIDRRLSGCVPRSSLASQPPHELERILSTAKRAGVTIVSLPLVNQWTQVTGVPFHPRICGAPDARKSCQTPCSTVSKAFICFLEREWPTISQRYCFCEQLARREFQVMTGCSAESE